MNLTSKPKRVVQFRASDGSMHDTYAAAQKHEHSLEFGNWLDEWMENNGYWREAPSGQDLAAAIRKEWTVSRRKGR